MWITNFEQIFEEQVSRLEDSVRRTGKENREENTDLGKIKTSTESITGVQTARSNKELERTQLIDNTIGTEIKKKLPQPRITPKQKIQTQIKSS